MSALLSEICIPFSDKPYPFKTVPFQHQSAIWERTRDKEAWALYMDLGSGKSKVLIDTTAWLYDTQGVNGLVVVAPKSVFRNWGNVDNGQLVGEIVTHMPAHIPYRIGTWTSERRKADVAALDALFDGGKGLYILLMNIEALSRDLKTDSPAYECLKTFLATRKCMFAIDESTTIKNPKALCTKAVTSLRLQAAYRRILCGRPDPQGPLDLFSQCFFLDWRLLGFNSFYTYKAHYAKLVQMQVRIPDQFDEEGNQRLRKFFKVDGYQNLPDLKERLSKFASIVKKEDCLDLPAKLPDQIRLVTMGPKQKRAYDSMRKMAIAEIERHVVDGRVQQPMEFQLEAQTAGVEDAPMGNFSIAKLVITQRLRLHQILCGYLVGDDTVPVPFDEPNTRIGELMATLEEVSGRAVVWATYKLSVEQIAAAIAKEYGPESVLKFYGPSSTEERAAVKRAFDTTHPAYNPDSPVRYVVANKAGARGNTWTAANTAIYYSIDNDSDSHEQSRDRIHRIGQNWPCSYLFLSAGPGTVDPKIYDDLATKRDLSKVITPSNWKDYI